MPASLTESTRALRAQESPIPSTPSMTGPMNGDGHERGPSSHGSRGYEAYTRTESFDHERSAAHAPSTSYASEKLPPMQQIKSYHDHVGSAAVQPTTEQCLSVPKRAHLPAPSSSDGLMEEIAKVIADSYNTASLRENTCGYHGGAPIPSPCSLIPAPLRSPNHVSFGNELDDDDDDVEACYESQLPLILAYLALPVPLLALILALYSLLHALLLLLIAPVRLCWKRPHTVPQSFFIALGPCLRVQLRLIESDLIPLANHPPAHPAVARLTIACIGAPLAALVTMLGAWTVGVFWLFAVVVGLPANRGAGRGGVANAPQLSAGRASARKDSEGRAAARFVRRVWAKWLLWGLNP